MSTRFTYTAVLLALTACSPTEKTAAPATVSAPAEVVSTKGKATSIGTASTIVTPTDDVKPTEHKQMISDAKWQAYQCDESGKIEARYVPSKTHAIAQIRYNRQTVAMSYNGELSNEDLTAFSGGDYTWTISNQFGTEFYKEDNGFLIQHGQQQISGENTPVDNILVKNCTPLV